MKSLGQISCSKYIFGGSKDSSNAFKDLIHLLIPKFTTHELQKQFKTTKKFWEVITSPE